MRNKLFAYILGTLFCVQMSGCWHKSSPHADSDTDSVTGNDSDTSFPDSTSGENSSDDTFSDTLADTLTDTHTDTQSLATGTDSRSDTASATEVAAPCWQTVFQDAGQRVTLVSGSENEELLAFRCRELLLTNSGNVQIVPQAELGYTACFNSAVETNEGVMVTDSEGGVQLYSNGAWTVLRDRETGGGIQIHQLAVHGSDLYVAGTWIRDSLGGDLSDSSFIRWDGAQWYSVSMPKPTLDYNRVHTLRDGSLVVATADGTLLSSTDGLLWSEKNILDHSEIADVWGHSASDFWLITNPTGSDSTGEYSTIYHCQPDCLELVNIADGVIDLSAVGADVRYWSIGGNANDDVYISGEFNMGSSGCVDDNECDKANPMEPILLHYDGSNLSEEAPGLVINEITDIWGSGSGEMYFSGSRLYFNGTDFLTPDDRILGRIAGFASDNIYVSGLVGMNRTGAHFDGVNWTNLEIALPVYDIAPRADGIVYGLGFAGEVLQWQNGETATIRDARCRQFRQTSTDPAGTGVALCSEGRVVVRSSSNWQMITALRDEEIKQFCYMGDALVGVTIATSGRSIVRYLDGTATVLETDELITTVLACNSTGTYILTENQQILRFDGTSLSTVATWSQEDGIINHMAVDEEGRIFADMSHNLNGYLLVWESGEWTQSLMPFEALSLAFSNSGPLLASSVDDATISEYTCGNQ